MVHFSLNIKGCSLYVIWEKQDQIWAKIFCILKNMHSRTPTQLTSDEKLKHWTYEHEVRV